jgi:hypothetical protein
VNPPWNCRNSFEGTSLWFEEPLPVRFSSAIGEMVENMIAYTMEVDRLIRIIMEGQVGTNSVLWNWVI